MLVQKPEVFDLISIGDKHKLQLHKHSYKLFNTFFFLEKTENYTLFS